MIPKAESRTFTVYTTANTPRRTLNQDIQIAFTIVPSSTDGNQPQVFPVAWKVFSFTANTNAQETAEIAYSYRISTVDVEGDKAWNVSLNSAGLSAADQYITLTGNMRWESYRLTDGSEEIVAINQTEKSQTFTIGTTARRKGFEPLVVLDPLQPRDAITFQLPSQIRAFAVSRYEVGQIISSHEAQILEPTPVSDLGLHTCWHLHSGENGPVLLEDDGIRPDLRVDPPPMVPEVPDLTSPLLTPILHELPLPPEISSPRGARGLQSCFCGSPIYPTSNSGSRTPKSTLEPRFSGVLGS